MISVTRALNIIDKNVNSLGTERIDLSQAVGRILAEDIVADTDLPPFDRSQMDGYALRSRDARNVPVSLMIVGESAAGRGWHQKVNKGQAVRIMTGAPVPAGADTVQKLEVAKESDGIVSLSDPVSAGQYIVKKGKEIRKGERVISSGTRLSPEMIATPAAFGYSRVKVAKMPRVAIISTGSEIVDVNKKPSKDQIRDSNSILLRSLCEQNGASVQIQTNVGDDLRKLCKTITEAARVADIVITTGGVSVGKYDLTKPAFAEIGAKILFDKIALKPGKPTVFAKRKKTSFFGLPGNPVSAAVTFYLFVRRAMMLMQSARRPALETGFAVMNDPAKGTRLRDVYCPARLATAADGKLLAIPLPWSGSSDLVAFAKAEALVAIPKQTNLNAGDVAEVLFL
jgi:molybdenum cofactor synthesis domain-containing protein